MWGFSRDGRFVPLGVRDPADEAGAVAAFEALCSHAVGPAFMNVHERTVDVHERTVADACAAFLSWQDGKATAGKVEARSVKVYRDHLKPLCVDLGARQLRSVTAEELERWADRPDWSASYQNNVLGTVGMCFRRAGHPLRISRPSKESRGADTCLTDEQFAEVLAVVRCGSRRRGGDLAELLEALRETGARPGELTGLTVEAVDWPNCCAVLRKHKTKRKTGKDRVIHFNTAAMAVLQRQRERHPTGLLFRNGWGRAFSMKGLGDRLAAVSLVVGFRVIAYGLRHAFVTGALCNGVPDTVVAALVGHASPQMIAKHYAHINGQSRVLKEAAERASGKRAG